MPISHLLEDFSGALILEEPETPEELALETERLAAFERGYAAGWDDSMRAQAEDQSKVSAALSQTLQDLSFTYREAHVQMLGSVTPIFDAILTQLLPGTLKDTLAPIVSAELAQLAAECGEGPLELVCAPSQLCALQAVFPKTSEAQVVTDTALEEGRVFLRVGQKEREINLDAVQEVIEKALTAFSYQVQKEQAHG